MRERDVNRKMFHAGHYNVIAKQIQDKLALFDTTHERAVLVDLALSLSKRFMLDNEEFDPLMFLDRCSPDPDTMPLSELWEGVNQSEIVDD